MPFDRFRMGINFVPTTQPTPKFFPSIIFDFTMDAHHSRLRGLNCNNVCDLADQISIGLSAHFIHNDVGSQFYHLNATLNHIEDAKVGDNPVDHGFAS